MSDLAQDRTRVVQLLSGLGPTSSVDERVNVLQQVQELVVERHPRELLREVAPALASMHTERALPLRKFTIKFIEKACSTNADLTPVLFPTLVSLSADDRPTAIKALMSSLIKVVPIAMTIIAQDQSQSALLWSNVQHVRGVAEQLLSSSNEGVRTATIKLLELFVVMFTSPLNAQEVSADAAFVSSRLPLNHPVVNPGQLDVIANEILVKLATVFQIKLTVNNRCGLVTALGSICRQRARHATIILPLLLSLQSKPAEAGLSQAAWKQVFHALKAALVLLCEQRSLVAQWSPMGDALRRLGFATEANQVHARIQQLGGVPLAKPVRAPQAKVSKSTTEEVDMDVDSSDSDSDDATSSSRGGPSSSSSSSHRAPSSSKQSPAHAGAGAGAGAASSSFQYQPRAKRGSVSAAGAAGDASAAAVAASPIGAAPQLQAPPPSRKVPAPASQQPAAAASTPAPAVPSSTGAATSLTPSHKQELAMLLSLPTNLIVRLVVRCVHKFSPPADASASPAQDSQALVSLVSQLENLAPKKRKEDEKPVEAKTSESAVSRRVVPDIQKVMPNFSDKDCLAMSLSAFRRALKSEKTIAIEGQQELYRSIITKMVTSETVNKKIVDEFKLRLLKHIKTDFVKHYDLALLWLFAVNSRPQSEKQYEDLLAALLKLMSDKKDSDKIFTKFLCEMPELTGAADKALRNYCENEDRVALGLVTLKEVIFLRPKDQMKALDHLLERGCDENHKTRTEAVGWLVREVARKAPDLREHITTRAKEFLSEILHPPTGAKPEEASESFVEQEVKKLGDKLVQEDNAFERNLRARYTREFDEERKLKKNGIKAPKKEKLGGGDKGGAEGDADDDGDTTMTDAEKKGKSAVKTEPKGASAKGDIDASDPEAAAKKADEERVDELVTNQMQAREAARRLKLEACREHAQFRRRKIIAELKAKEPELVALHIARHIQLFMSLSLNEPELLSFLLETYTKGSPEIQAAIRSEAVVAEVVGLLSMTNDKLLEVIKNCPKGAEPLVVVFLEVLTEKPSDDEEGVVAPKPTQNLVRAVKALFSKIKDARIFVPIISGLNERDIMDVLPKLVILRNARDAIDKVFSQRPPAILPQDFLVALHDLCPTKKSKNLEQVKNLISHCLQRKKIFNSEVLAIVLQRLLVQNPIPILFMRTMIQILKAYPRLTSFAMRMLRLLITKRVYNNPDLWEGFIRCCNMTKPHCFVAMSELPLKWLKEVLRKSPSLREPFKKYASRRTGLRDEVSELLGLKSKAGEAPLGDFEIVESRTTEPRSAVLRPSGRSGRRKRGAPSGGSGGSRGGGKSSRAPSVSVAGHKSTPRRPTEAPAAAAAAAAPENAANEKADSSAGKSDAENEPPSAAAKSDAPPSKRRRIGVGVVLPDIPEAADKSADQAASSSSSADSKTSPTSDAVVLTSNDTPGGEADSGGISLFPSAALFGQSNDDSQSASATADEDPFATQTASPVSKRPQSGEPSSAEKNTQPSSDADASSTVVAPSKNDEVDQDVSMDAAPSASETQAMNTPAGDGMGVSEAERSVAQEKDSVEAQKEALGKSPPSSGSTGGEAAEHEQSSSSGATATGGEVASEAPSSPHKGRPKRGKAAPKKAATRSSPRKATRAAKAGGATGTPMKTRSRRARK